MNAKHKINKRLEELAHSKQYLHLINPYRKLRLKSRGTLRVSNNYTIKEYKQFVSVHTKTLEKYLREFSTWFYVCLLKRKNYDFSKKVMSKIQLESIISKARPVMISEITALFKHRDLKNEFIEYLYNKTLLSYEFKPNIPVPIHYNGKYTGRVYSKLAEFVFIILA